MPQRLTKSSIYSRSLHLLVLQLVLLCRDKNKVCLLCEVSLKQIPAFNFFCASLETISAIEDTWERWEVWEDIQVVPGVVWGGKDGFMVLVPQVVFSSLGLPSTLSFPFHAWF
ncbi:hypothetical protein Tco_0211794 [Tanacetum coccineum]